MASYDKRLMYIGETEAVNKTHERWCQSKDIIKIKRNSTKLKTARNENGFNMLFVSTETLSNTCLETYMYALYAVRDDLLGVAFEKFKANFTSDLSTKAQTLFFACL